MYLRASHRQPASPCDQLGGRGDHRQRRPGASQLQLELRRAGGAEQRVQCIKSNCDPGPTRVQSRDCRGNTCRQSLEHFNNLNLQPSVPSSINEINSEDNADSGRIVSRFMIISTHFNPPPFNVFDSNLAFKFIQWIMLSVAWKLFPKLPVLYVKNFFQSFD